MNKLATLALAGLMAVSLANAQDIKPTRVGPVSQYGELITGKNSSNEGRIYGSCDGAVSGKEVQVRGNSLFWAIDEGDGGASYWTSATVGRLVKNMNSELVRAAMGVDGDWGAGNYFTNTSKYQAMIDDVVKGAIENDIYVIIDFHSHEAHQHVDNAKTFFETNAQKWGKYDNVIFEIYNEPTDVSWSTIKKYANEVVPVIRKYSDNLILVGTRSWDQHPEEVIGNTVSGENIAYVLHFYAASHCVSGSYSWGGSCEGANGEKAIKAGLPLFVSEWGSVEASGNGGVNESATNTWMNFLDKYQLSSANWSVAHKSEGASIFPSDMSKTDNWSYTTAGNYLKNKVLSKNPTSYTQCPTNGEEQEPEEEESAISLQNAASLNFSIAGGILNLVGAKSATVDVFDLQGRSVLGMKNVKSSVELAGLKSGAYIVRVKDGSASLTRKVSIR